MNQIKRKFAILKFRVEKKLVFAPKIVLLAVVLILSLLWVPAGSAQGNSPVIRQVQVLEGHRTGLSNPVGIAFSTRANAFQVLEGQGGSAPGDLVRLTHIAERAGTTQLTAAVQNPINVAYDPVFGRLFFFSGASEQLFEIPEGPDGNFDPGTLARRDIRSWEVQEPQGIAVDGAGVLYILDAAGPGIVRVEPGTAGSLDSARVTKTTLSLATPRGIAYDPTTGHLHVMVPTERALYELSQSGEVIGVRDLSQFDLENPQGMVFAPSGDQTDDLAQVSLYLADGASAEGTGQIVELSLVTAAALPAGTTLLPATLVETFNTSSWSNPSPDPSGMEYWPATGQLLILDSEIEESVSGNPPAYWKGYNLFISTLSGSLDGNCTTYKSGTTSLVYNNFAKEPTGIAVNENNNHLFFSDDDAHKIFELSLGADGKYCTTDDTVVSLSTSGFGAGDSEDVTYGDNSLFIAGGTDGEVYQFSLGENGVIGGGDDGPMTHFDTAALGFNDLEGIEYRQDTGTLFIVSTRGSENYLGEVSTSGTLLRAYNLPFMGTTSNMRSAVVYAPDSQNQSVMNIYIASRGVDNNTNRLENDGKVWEISIASTPTPTSTAGSSPTPTQTATSTPTTTSTPTPTQTATSTPTTVSSPTPTQTATNTPTPTPTTVVNQPILLPAGWVGGVSITSNKNVVAVDRPHIGSEVASYDGFSSGSLTVYMPMLFKTAFGSYDSALYVQNVHASSAAHITIKYYDSAGNLSCTKTDTISSMSSKGYWVPSESCLPVGWVGGAVVTSDQPIVAVGRPHVGTEVMTYEGFTSGSLTSYIPMLFNNSWGSYNSAFYVQNVHASSTAHVTIKYYNSEGVLNCTKADTIAPLASRGYWVPSTSCDTGSLPDGWTGGVVVKSDQPIVGVGRPHIGGQVTTYDGFSTGSLKSYIPMLFSHAWGSYNSAFYLQNTHATNTAHVTLKYYNNNGGLDCTRTDTISPLASRGYWVPSATCDTGSLPDGWVGGVIVTSDQPVVGVGRPHIGEQVTTYTGFTSGNAGSYLPMLFKEAWSTYNSAFYIQNTETGTATVTLRFYDAGGVLSCTRTDTIPALSTLGFWMPSVSCTP